MIKITFYTSNNLFQPISASQIPGKDKKNSDKRNLKGIATSGVITKNLIQEIRQRIKSLLSFVKKKKYLKKE